MTDSKRHSTAWDDAVVELAATIRYAYAAGPARDKAIANLDSLEEQLEAAELRQRQDAREYDALQEQLGAAQRERDWWRERYLLDVTPDAGQVARLDYEAAEFAEPQP